MKESGNKIIVLCDLPTDYGLPKLLDYSGLNKPADSEHFYVITKDKKIVIRNYLENGFSFEDTPVGGSHTFNISSKVHGAMGLWTVTYRVTTNSGNVTNIIELNTTL